MFVGQQHVWNVPSRCEGLSQMPGWFLLSWGDKWPCSLPTRLLQPLRGSGWVGWLQGVLCREGLHTGSSKSPRCGLHAGVSAVFRIRLHWYLCFQYLYVLKTEAFTFWEKKIVQGDSCNPTCKLILPLSYHSVSGSICLYPDRFVCPLGSSKPNAPTNACPPGTLSNRTDLTDRSQCQQCPARYACLRGAVYLSHTYLLRSLNDIT